MPFKKKDAIRQKVVVIEGTVSDVRYDADSGQFQYLIEYLGADAEVSQRWFDESEVEAA